MQYATPTTNMPVMALLATCVMVLSVVVVISLGYGGENGGAILIGLVVSTIPSLIAAAFSERVSRDVRNGVLTEKSKEGVHLALQESGVQEVVDLSQRGQTSLVALQALQRLLEEREVAENKQRAAEQALSKQEGKET